ncbi:glycoside hydrolase family 127 protein [Arthrospiribacter ruber]|uniref:Glycosyl hydrolase n=1 Tax=Arthrospiribacter ruber TaxID=2487934 RepID=A0A951IYD1_9BACT|nr:glycoside hydrolase family 127 protein [Arthrospiribacter ruber]MBW3468394.1 glycosyl hydrolase [Arthrospiribacter ruber]
MRPLIIILLLFIFQCTLSQQAKAQDDQVQFFDLRQVKLKDSPFKRAQEVDKKYILEMDVDRLLAPYMKEAGLTWSADNYGNWENTGLDGHIGGHYLSALSLMFASTGDPEINKRLDYMLEQLKLAQDQSGDGYLGGVPDGRKIWNELKSGKINAGNFSLNDRWVPLYNIHKIFAGLRDAYWIGGKEIAKPMLVSLSDWFLDLTDGFTEDQFQEMLISEHGGLNEVFADVAVMTGDSKYLSLAKKMSHNAILQPLKEEKDELNGLHANTQIPKVIGFQRIAQVSKDQNLHQASDFFWKNVVHQRSVSIGGNSVREHFHPTSDFSSMLSSEQGPETCNTYNMMRLSEMLFQLAPDRKYIDYYERAVFNHILSTQHPEKGGFVYFTSMRPQHYRVYSQPHENFWCCVGSGLENHAKYGQAIYAYRKDDLYLNLFIASELDWQEKGIKLIQKTDFPYKDESEITFSHKGKKSFNLKIRYPNWVKEGMLEVTINGEQVEVSVDRHGYITLNREWTSKDKINLKLPMETKAERLPDGSNWVSFSHGPIVLGAKTGADDLKGLFADESRMGHVAAGKMVPLELNQVLKKENNPLPVQQEGFRFLIASNEFHQSDEQIELLPFFEIHDSRYQLYWPIADKDELGEFKNQLYERDELMRRLEEVTVDQVAAGEQQPETEHSFKGRNTEIGQENGRFWRQTSDFFQYILKNQEKEGKVIRVIYLLPSSDEEFNIYINGDLLKKESLAGVNDQLYMVDYNLENKNAEILEFKIESNGRLSPKIHHIRLMKRSL